jgi:exosortase/archaeosortase
MLALGSLTNLQIRIKEVVPLLAIFKKIEYVVKPDNFLTVSNLINTTVKALGTVSKSVSALSVISEAKQKTLDTQQKLMDGVDTKLKALNVSNFETTVDFDAAKKSLESQKETISKTIEKALK